jgi:hypothetical protein
MPSSTSAPPTSGGGVARSGGRSGCAIPASIVFIVGLIGAVGLSGRYRACTDTAGSEAGFWCAPELIGTALAIVIATAAAAIVAMLVAPRVVGSSTSGRRLVPTLLAGLCVAIGLWALATVMPRSGGPATPTGLWAPASDADSALADRLLAVWTEGDIAAVDDLYAEDARLIPNPRSYDAKLAANLGFDAPLWVDRDGIREAVSLASTTYTREGPVTVTEDAIPGLRQLPEGGRYLHWVMSIRGQWFETVVVLGDDGKIHDHYVDEYYGTEVRREVWFQLFEGVFGTPIPS